MEVVITRKMKTMIMRMVKTIIITAIMRQTKVIMKTFSQVYFVHRWKGISHIFSGTFLIIFESYGYGYKKFQKKKM